MSGVTIGEVLNRLKQDFEDITISKIRFLESEGLISPERSESGYRQFSDDDVDRLRYILTAQRDHFLPLRVIREQLARVDAGETGAPADGAPGGFRPAPMGPPMRGAVRGEGGDGQEEQLVVGAGPTEVSMTLREFCDATGLDAVEVRALRDYGVVGERGGDLGPFDGDDLLAGRAARDLLRLGLEPRHLRMYRTFVDRELALFEQLITPMLRQRKPDSRPQATQQLERLTASTNRLQRSLLGRALRGYLKAG